MELGEEGDGAAIFVLVEEVLGSHEQLVSSHVVIVVILDEVEDVLAEETVESSL